MKTVKQPAEIAFNALDFADKVVMLPLMDILSQTVQKFESLEMAIESDANTTEILPEQAVEMLKVLSDMGCRTSLGESYKDIIESHNSQK